MLMFGWTTVSQIEDANRLAEEAVRQALAACVQIEGPVDSVFVWNDKLQHEREYRLMFKFIPARGRELESWILENHPYDVPEWIVVRAERVAEKYLSWARANSTSAPF